MKRIGFTILAKALLFSGAGSLHAAPEIIEANRMREFSLVSSKPYANPFVEVELDAVLTRPDGKQLRVPAFWAGG